MEKPTERSGEGRDRSRQGGTRQPIGMLRIPRSLRRQVERRTERARKKGRMKYIKFDKEFKSPDGFPVYIDDPDTEKQRARAEEAYELAKKAVEDEKRLVQPLALKVQADFPGALTWFLNNIPWAEEKLTDSQESAVAKGERQRRRRKVETQEAGSAYAAITALRGVRNGVLELEDGVYEDLVKTLEVDAVEAFSAPVAGAIMARVKNNFAPEPTPAKSKGKAEEETKSEE